VSFVPLLNGSYERPFEAWIRNRLTRQNKNLMGVFVGETGSSKSWSAISVASTIDPDFDISRIAVSTREMVEVITTEKLRKGSALVLDEAGVNYSNKRWMTSRNMELGKLFQTFRFMNLALFHTLPHFRFLDSTQRALIHMGFVSQGVRRKEKIALFSARYFTHDPFSRSYDDMRYTYPLIHFPNGRLYKVKTMAVQLADKKLLIEYEVKKREWNKRLQAQTYKRIVKGITEKDEKEEEKKRKKLAMKYEMDAKLRSVADEVKRNLDSYIKKYAGERGWDLNAEFIRADFTNVSTLDSRRIVRFLKGLPEVKEYLIYKNEEEESKKRLKELKKM